MKQPLTLPIDPSAPLGIGFEDLLCWLRVKLDEAKHSLKCREDMQKTWAGGTDASWRAAGCRDSKATRLAHSASHGRIAVKCRREVEMFNATIAAIKSQRNE